MDHDAAHKYIYSLPEVTADLLRLVARDWMDELDFATLQDRSAEFLDADHRKRQGDLVFSVRLRRGRLTDGTRAYVLVLLEFQSEVDRRMAKRVREYAEMLLDQTARSGAAGQEGGLPWVLPIVVYNGSEPWTAAGRENDLAPPPSERMARDLALLQPQAYRLLAAGGALTSGTRAADDWPLNNRVSATVRLQASRTPQELLPHLLQEMARFPGSGNAAFRQALHAWAKALWVDQTGDETGFPAIEELERTGELTVPTLLQANWARWEAGVRTESFERGIERGIRQGRAEGGLRLISRQAALKFGTGTAERLTDLLRGRTEQDDLDRVGNWILECGNGDELLSRVSALLTDKSG